MVNIPNHIRQKIYFVRGHRVMLDSDLAELYGVATKTLTQAVRRNIKRFPDDFIFQLTNQDLTILRSQFVTSRLDQAWGGRRYLPHAFTEQGVAMLSSVLKSERAVLVNVEIMRAFVNLRKILSENKELAKRIDQLELKYDSQFKSVFDAIRKLMDIGSSLAPKQIKGLDPR